jgi:hypothetical protein
VAGRLVSVDGAHHQDPKGRVRASGHLHLDRTAAHRLADALGVGIARAEDERGGRRTQNPVQSDFALEPESADEPDELDEPDDAEESEEPEESEELELPELSVFEVAVSFEPSFEPESPPPPPRARP